MKILLLFHYYFNACENTEMPFSTRIRLEVESLKLNALISTLTRAQRVKQCMKPRD